MNESHEKIRQRRSKTLYVWLGFCVLLLGVFIWFYLFTDSPFRISKETTYITEPLTPDGTRIDYRRAVEERTYPPQMRTDDNGCRILTRAIGPPPGVVEKELQEQYYEKLGLPPTHTPSMRFADLDTFIGVYLSSRPEDYGMWKDKYIHYRKMEDPEFAPYSGLLDDPKFIGFVIGSPEEDGFELSIAWWHQTDPILDVLAEAVRKPEFVAPYVFPPEQTHWDLDAPLPEWEFYSNLCSTLLLRAYYRTNNGNIDGMIDDMITYRRLVRFMTRRGEIRGYSKGLSFETDSTMIGLNLSSDDPPNAEQLKRFLRELDELPDYRVIEDVLEEGRLWRLSMIQQLADAPDRSDQIMSFLSDDTPTLVTALGYEWSAVMKHYNHLYDQSVAGNWRYSPPTQMSVWLGRNSRSEKLAHAIISSTRPYTESDAETKRGNQCRDQMQRIAISMLLYEKEHGTLPPPFTLDAENRPLHSWRVLVLPYLGENEKELYEKIRLEEPWNSEWNTQFHETEINFFTCPNAVLQRKEEKNAKKGLTDYTVVPGKGMPFAILPTFDSGTNKTTGRRSKDYVTEFDAALLAERREPICWMVPDQEILLTNAESSFDERKSSTVISQNHDHSSNIAFISGAAVEQSDSYFEYMKWWEQMKIE